MKKIIIKFFRLLGYELVKVKQVSESDKQSFKEKCRYIINKISPEFKIIQGPFKGMQYPHIEITESALVPKITGSYESQLHGIVEEVIATNYSDIIDVGCAEGYYAVGFAKRMPQTTIHAFDINKKDLEFCKNMAALNNVSNLTYNDFCSPSTLIKFQHQGKLLVFCDAEGYEFELFTQEVISSMKNTDFLIELHDILNPQISTVLIERFSSTHQIQIVNNRQADVTQFFNQLSNLEEPEKHFAVLEHRGGYNQNCFMEWAYCVAISNTN